MDVIIGVPTALVFTITILKTILDAIFAVAPVAPAAGPLHGFKVKPFVNDFVPTKDSVLADFTPPVTAGLSTAVAPAAGVSFNSSDGAAEMVAATCQFVASADPASPETVYGVIWTDAAGTGFYGAERFTTPVVVSKSGDGLVYVPRFTQPRM